jgi:hypothetical protein
MKYLQIGFFFFFNVVALSYSDCGTELVVRPMTYDGAVVYCAYSLGGVCKIAQFSRCGGSMDFVV